MAFVLAALDQPGGLKPAWRMTEGLGWRLLGATLLCAIATVPVMLFFKLLGSLLDGVLDLRRAPTAMGPAEVITSTIGGSMATLIALLAISTLVGVVYRLLMPPAPAV